MSGALLDTSVLIADAGVAASVLPPSAAISVVSVGELHAGVRLARTAEVAESRRVRLRRVRAAFRALTVDDDVAERYGEVLAFARSEGRISKATDLLIIATTLSTARDLVTLDHSQAQLARALGLTVLGSSTP